MTIDVLVTGRSSRPASRQRESDQAQRRSGEVTAPGGPPHVYIRKGVGWHDRQRTCRPTTRTPKPAYARSPEAVVSDLGSDIEQGLSDAEVAQQQSTYGLNEIAAEKPPSVVAVAGTAARSDEHHAGRRDPGQHPHR